MDNIIFSFQNYWQFYLWFTVGVLALLALDLGVFNRKTHVVSMKEAAVWSVIWIILALIFNGFFYWYSLSRFSAQPELMAQLGTTAEALAGKMGLEFLTGYLVEKSLAVDNLFIFVVIFSFFSIPPAYQHRVLFFGIIGALIFRAIFIALGSVLMQYKTVVIIFGLFLIATGIKLFFTPKTPKDLSSNWVLKLVKKIIPTTSEFHGEKFLVRLGGKLHATPLFVALAIVEATDIIFAVDSVPAIFALTKEPLIVFTSNIFAILGLRSLYFLLLGVYDRFYLLKYGLGIVLVFVGLKMAWLNEAFGGKFPISWSLGIIGGVIGLSIVLSLLTYDEKKHGAAVRS